mgnify:CR=1 FL=1
MKIYLLYNSTYSMKILSYFSHNKAYLLVLLFFILVSCEQESIQDNPATVETPIVRLTACHEDESSSLTRTALAEDNHTILWTAHDQIKVFTQQTLSGSLFESLNNSPSKNADFEGELDISGVSVEKPIYAIYPYSESASFDGTSITAYLASEQVAKVDGFADNLLPAIAVSNDLNLSFCQVATGIRFLISTEGVRKVIFRGNKGEAVSGTFKVSMNSENRPVITDVIDGSQWVSLVAPENGTFEVGKMYYLSVLPQEFKKGFTLTFLTDTQAARYIFNENVVFKRAVWKNGKNLEEGIVYDSQMLSNGLPIVEVDVEDGKPVESKETWNICSIRIGENYYDSIVSDGKIRGRGNATWWLPKRPYRIKFDSKVSPFGFPANKDWVLLAEYNDKSLLRLSYMCEVSKAVGAEFTVNYKHVNLYLNGEYKGVYVLTDQVKVGENRVNVESDGFLLEEDLYYESENLWFTTNQGFNFSFKYPDADDGEIIKDDDNYSFITYYFAQLEASMLNISNEPENVSSLVDYRSFAKWYIIQELTGNWEPNRYYVLKSRTSKLMMYPSWDSEWSMGLALYGNPDNPYGWYYPPAQPDNEVVIWQDRQYFKWLFSDPNFIVALKEEWNDFKPKLSSITDEVIKVENSISQAQKDNFKVWPILDQYTSVGLIALGSWEAEVEYVNNFFANRSTWMDNYINSL